MNTKMMKVLVTVLSAVVMVAMLGTVVFGANAITPETLKGQISYEGTEGISTLGGRIMGIIQTVGVVLAVVILMVLGIKYMMGSAEEKADYKKTMMPYVIGAVFIFGATTIANMIFNFTTKL